MLHPAPGFRFPAALAALATFAAAAGAQPKAGQSPADHLPPSIVQLTAFGERPDWSADGKKILFLSKTFGDAMELDLATRRIRNLTAHFPHHGFVRALYLANGDILLTGPKVFAPAKAAQARRECYFHLLDKTLAQPAVLIDVKCNEGPAVSRTRLHLAWAEWTDATSGPAITAYSQIFEADLVATGGRPALVNRRLLLDNRELPFACTLEPQNFRPPAETELTFSAYTARGTGSEVGLLDLATKKWRMLTDSADTYDEPEGIFPDGRHTLVECDRHNHLGTGHIDLWKLALDGSGTCTRVTFFSDYPNYKASNPVVSDDGKFIAFQMGRSGDAAGVGHGIFLLDLAPAEKTAR